MNRIVLVLAMFFATSALFASESIQGRVIDSRTQTPIEFANITILKTEADKSVGGAITNNEGIFNISSVPDGNYKLRISFVGYQTLSKVISVSGSKIALGDLALEEDSKTLKEVEVVGQGSQMRFDIDKKVFSVDQNIAAAGGSATEVLQNIPSVNVDNEGNISLRNNESVEVWINGKPAGLTAENRAQVLQQLPAESIESIEVMTNPSAKFNPEGTAGIINLVMKKNKKAGYYGNIGAGLMVVDGGKIGGNTDFSINYSNKKFETFANIGYRKMNMQGEGFSNRTNYNNGDTTVLKQNSTTNRNFGGLFLRGGIDYHLNDKNTLGITAFGMNGNRGENSLTEYKLSQANSQNLLRDYSRDNEESGDHPGYNVSLNHKVDFDKLGSNLITNISVSGHDMNSDNRYIQTDKINTTLNQDITQTGTNNNRELEIKTDYTKKFSENDRLEMGWNSTWEKRLSESDGYDNKAASEIATYYNKFINNEQIHAAYATFGKKINSFSAQVGLRGEYYARNLKSIDKIQEKPFSDHSFDLFPSAYLSYTLPKNNELQLNYTKRVNRPRGRQVNSFRDYADSTNISYGNPTLNPEFASAFELNYLKNWDNHTLSASLFYRYTDDVIQRVSFMNNNTMESTFMNMTKQQNAGLELVAKNRLFKILNLTSSLNFYKEKIDPSTYTNPLNAAIKVTIPGQDDFSWNARVIANLLFSKTFSGQVTGQYSAPQLIAQGERDASYSLDLGLRKTLLDKKINLNLMVRDLLNSRKMSSKTWGDGFYQVSENKFAGRMIGLTVSYNFGNMKPQKNDKKPATTNPGMDDTEMGQ